MRRRGVDILCRDMMIGWRRSVSIRGLSMNMPLRLLKMHVREWFVGEIREERGELFLSGFSFVNWIGKSSRRGLRRSLWRRFNNNVKKLGSCLMFVSNNRKDRTTSCRNSVGNLEKSWLINLLVSSIISSPMPSTNGKRCVNINIIVKELWRIYSINIERISWLGLSRRGRRWNKIRSLWNTRKFSNKSSKCNPIWNSNNRKAVKRTSRLNQS